MGLVTDSSNISQKKKYTRLLINYNRIICVLLYFAAIGWFCCLVDNNLNTKTYFSENALLPGLVYSEMKAETTSLARNIKIDLDKERESHPDKIPYSWLVAKMRRIGLETHTHNFTLNYPLGSRRKFTGKNVYGILRAPRIGSTECLVITVPYRPPSSLHPDISSGVAVMLAFADFARRQKYWAKDIIFLITDKEQLGMQAWLEAYHSYEDNSVLDFGSLNARAGSIQAAINLEIHDFSVDYINVKLEGLNGQLPNLDLHNLVQKLSHKHGYATGYKINSSINYRITSTEQKLKKLLSMILSQSSGVPTGNHGLFHKYGIEAVTLECIKSELTNHQQTLKDLSSLLQIVEGIFRSLNNLLERFHQSFFFYLMVTGDRFISIGDYMPSLGLMAGSLLIKAFIVWLSITQEKDDLMLESEDDDNNDENLKRERKVELQSKEFNYIKIGVLFIIAHVIGVLASYLPFTSFLDNIIHWNNIPTPYGLFYIFLSIGIVSLILPVFTKLNDFENEVLHIVVLIETGTALIVIGMLNFSLGIVLSTIIVPFGILINPRKLKIKFLQFISRMLCSFLHPLMLSYIIVFIWTLTSFEELPLPQIATRAFTATLDCWTYFVVDSVIYGNWMFDIITIIFVPVWIMFWISLFPRAISNEQTKLKIN